MKRKLSIIIPLISLISFLILLYDVLFTGYLKSLNESVASLIASIQYSFLYKIMQFISLITEPVSLAIISYVIALRHLKSKKIPSKFIVIVISINLLIIWLSKKLIDSPRPVDSLVTSSFPSGHVAMAVVFFGIFSFILIKNKFLSRTSILTTSAIAIILISINRLYLNVHWFSDVLGGFFLGVLILSTSLLFNYSDKKTKKK